MDFTGAVSVMKFGVGIADVERRLLPLRWRVPSEWLGRPVGGRWSGEASLTVTVGTGVDVTGAGRGEVSIVRLGGIAFGRAIWEMTLDRHGPAFHLKFRGPRAASGPAVQSDPDRRERAVDVAWLAP
jgi:hypothetical protein